MEECESEALYLEKAKDEEVLFGISNSTLRKESKQILKHYEHDYKHDLAVHLYSTYLMHQQNPSFPKANWSSWPIAKEQVPDPKTTELYTDEPESIKHNKREGTPVPPINEDNDHIFTEIRSQETPTDQPKLRSDPEHDLRVELERMFKRKIYHGINEASKQNEKYELQPSLEYPRLSDIIFERITRKVDDLIGSFPDSIVNLKYSGIYDWKDILLKSGISDEKLTKDIETLFGSTAKKTLDEFSKQAIHEDENDESDITNESDETDDSNDSSGKDNENSSDSVKDDENYESQETNRNKDNSSKKEETLRALALRKQLIDRLYNLKNRKRKLVYNTYLESLELDAPDFKPKRRYIQKKNK